MTVRSVTTRHPRVVHSQLNDGETVLLHLETGQYHELNPIGAVIWELLDGERSLTEVTEALRARVADPPDELEEFVAEFLEELRDRGLVT